MSDATKPRLKGRRTPVEREAAEPAAKRPALSADVSPTKGPVVTKPAPTAAGGKPGGQQGLVTGYEGPIKVRQKEK
jgi:hypothetical protein